MLDICRAQGSADPVLKTTAQPAGEVVPTTEWTGQGSVVIHIRPNVELTTKLKPALIYVALRSTVDKSVPQAMDQQIPINFTLKIMN